MSAARLLTGQHLDGARRFAAVDPDARNVAGEVRPSRLAAWLAPFRTLEDAEAALVNACCELVDG